MKKTIAILMSAAMALVFSGAALSGIVSLRGDNDLQAGEKEPAMLKQEIVPGGIERSYEKQPPMIPHKIEKDEINLKVNTCMNCHSEKTYEQKKAPKAGDSHYVNRDGKVLEKVSTRRYFCNQCHAPQMGASPLVENNFEGAK